MSGSDYADAMNAKMAKLVPELASPLAKYPLKRTKWLDPKENGPKGEPCFMASTGDTSRKPDYVYGRGPYGAGHYHLLTRPSYMNLYARMTHQVSVGCCACSKEARKQLSDYEDVKRIVYNRSVGSIPDDDRAAQDAIDKARGVAQAWHNGLQNEQLAVGAVQFAAM